jgi:hypothetical protein
MVHEIGKRRGEGRLSDGAESEVSCHGDGCLLDTRGVESVSCGTGGCHVVDVVYWSESHRLCTRFSEVGAVGQADFEHGWGEAGTRL